MELRCWGCREMLKAKRCAWKEKQKRRREMLRLRWPRAKLRRGAPTELHSSFCYLYIITFFFKPESPTASGCSCYAVKLVMKCSIFGVQSCWSAAHVQSQVPWVQARSITWKRFPCAQQEASFNQRPPAQPSFGADNGERLFAPASPIWATTFSSMGPWWIRDISLSWGNLACPSGEGASVGWLDALLFHKDINNIQGVTHEWQIWLCWIFM